VNLSDNNNLKLILAPGNGSCSCSSAPAFVC